MDNKDLNNLNSSAPQKVQPSVPSGSASSDLEALKQRWPANSAEGLCVRRYGDRESFLKNFNPGRQNELCHPRYVDFIFCGVAPELGVVERAYGRPCLESWLMIQLADLQEFFPSQERLTTQQLEQAAGLIANQFPLMKISEFMYFLQRVKAGHYGHFYGRLDLIHLTAALQDFQAFSARCTRRIQNERRLR
ncbi:MAG: hypothetical protein K6F20_03290 [Bacteroidaceae bacterium]|nr:hypothetical protein [Bacteroidaceae bacterium]